MFFNLPTFISILPENENDPLNSIPTTPLGLAAAHNRENMAVKLLENGAKVNITQEHGQILRAPLYDAIFYRNDKIIDILLRHGADMTQRLGTSDASPLDLAYQVYRGNIAKRLAAHISGTVPTKAQELQFLVRGAFAAELERALQEGLEVNHPCENGKLALDYAQELGNQKIIKILLAGKAISKLTWPPVKSDSCPFPLNFHPSPATSPLVSKQKSWAPESCVKVKSAEIEEDSEDDLDDVSENEAGPENVFDDSSSSLVSGDSERLRSSALLLEVTVPESGHPIKSIVFETISCDQGWSKHFDQRTYLGSTRSWIQVRMKHSNGSLQSFRIQHNLHASGDLRLHTNIWNLSELEIFSPRKAEFLRNLCPSSILRISAHASGGRGWANYVTFVQVRMYGEEVKNGKP